MEVTYTLEPGDYAAFQKFIRRRGSRTRLAILVAAIVVGFSVGFGPTIISGLKHPRQSQKSDVIGQIASVVIPLLIIVVFWTLVMRFVVKPQANNSLTTVPQTVSIKQEHLYWQQQGTRTTVHWSDFVDVTHDTRLLYFFKSKNVAYIVPRRAFSSPDAADTFLKSSLAYWKGQPISNVDNLDAGIWPPPPRLGA